MHTQRKQNLLKKLDRMLHKINLNKLIPIKTKEMEAHYKFTKKGTSFAEAPTKLELDIIERLS